MVFCTFTGSVTSNQLNLLYVILNYLCKFMNTNKIIFDEFKQTINEEHVTFLNNMESLKSKVKVMFGEDSLRVNMTDVMSSDLQMNINKLKNELMDDCDDDTPSKVKNTNNSNIL